MIAREDLFRFIYITRSRNRKGKRPDDTGSEFYGDIGLFPTIARFDSWTHGITDWMNSRIESSRIEDSRTLGIRDGSSKLDGLD